MEITIKDLQKKIPLNISGLRQLVRMVLCQTGITQANLSFVFVSRQRMTALNRKYLRRNCATDVLAFDLNDIEVRLRGLRRGPTSLNGEIIISADAALLNARAYQVPLSREIALYLIHGILHLLGYDDHRPADTRRMREKERALLDVLGSKANRLIK